MTDELTYRMGFSLVFDEVIVKQLKKAAKNNEIKQALNRMFDKLELLGSAAGELLDSRVRLFEMKQKHPPIRLYYREKDGELLVFEFELKSSKKSQQKTIDRLKTRGQRE